MNIKKYCFIAVMISCFLWASFSFAGNIVITGSTSVLPIARKIAEAYMNQKYDVKISVSGGGSGYGIKALINGTADIAGSSRFLKDSEIEKAVDKKLYPVPFAIAYDCIVPIVHPSNPISNLTVQQLKDIYRGRIRNWKQIGGPDQRIVIISRNTSSGTYDVWENIVMNEEKITRGASCKDSNAEIVQAVSGNNAAIGYVAIGYLDRSVKGLNVNDIHASAETAADGSYPIHRALFIFTNGWPEGDILDFINFVLDPEKGQKYVEEAGFAPLY